VKNIVCYEKTANLRPLRHGIKEAIVTVSEVMLVNTWRVVSTRVEHLMMLTFELTR
jgi:hypothetical protein